MNVRLGLSGHPDVIKRSKKLFADHIRGKKCASELRAAIYKIVLKSGDNSTYDEMIKVWVVLYTNEYLQFLICKSFDLSWRKKNRRKILEF